MPNRQLAVGTISFAVCFAAWGLISAFATRFRDIYHLSASQTALLVAVPVLLGSLARLPMGLLTDRFKGRGVFAALLAFSAIPALLVPMVSSYAMLIAIAFLLGISGSSFAVGVGFVSPWFPKERQGGALGIYGIGNAGQSVVVFLGPLVAMRFGWENAFRGVAVVLLLWAVAFVTLARNAPVIAQPKTLADMLAVLGRERLAWVLSAFYFLTFGGFVAFSIYLPALLRQEFGLTAANAGFRAAGFVLLATGMRPLGGWLSDRIGGARVLSLAFFGAAPFALLLAWPSMLPFTVGALGCAALLGAGSGAVFKLVPQYFPAETGTVTGLVGAMGGLGGFFPPLLLGVLRDRLGVIWPGFVLLSLTAVVLGIVNGRVFLRRDTAAIRRGRTFDRLRAGAWATLWTSILIAAIVVGSRNLQDFDPALVIYTFAVIFATWGVVYHYNVWLEKPPTRMYWDRGWRIFWSRGPIRSFGAILRTAITHLFAQNFIRRRFGSALVDAPVHLLGMPPGHGDHVPVSLRLDRVPQPPGRPDDLRHLFVRILGGSISLGHSGRPGAISRARHRGLPGAGWNRAVFVAADARSRRAGGAIVRDGLFPSRDPVRHFNHGPGIDRLARMGARRGVQFSRDPARHHGNRGAALPALRKVLPHFPETRSVRRKTVSAHGRCGPRDRVRPLWSALRIPNAHSRPEEDSATTRFRLLNGNHGRALASAMPRLQAQDAGFGPNTHERASAWLSLRPRSMSSQNSLVPIRISYQRAAGKRNRAIRRRSWSKRTAVFADNNAAYSSRCEPTP